MYIKIVGDTTKYQGKLERVSLHLIKVSGLIKHESGFRLYLDNDVMVGDYSNFIYPYNDPNLGEGVFMYSDNNMDYEEENNKPSKEEQRKKEIETVVLKTVSSDINSLSEQLISMNETLLPMYEVLIQIQEALTNSSEETNNSEPTEPIVDNGNVDEDNTEHWQ